MKIRLNNQFYINIKPAERNRYELFEAHKEGGLTHWGNFNDVNKAVFAAVDIIVANNNEGEITLSQYQTLIDDTSKELFEGVIEYD